jgi:hypothetical protein
MQKARITAIGAIAALALLGGVGATFTQNAPAQYSRVIEVPAGAMVLVLRTAPQSPPQTMIDADFPTSATVMRRINQMMVDAQRTFAAPSWSARDRTIDAAWRQMPLAAGFVSGMVVTSFSSGHGTCTQRVTYSGDGTTPRVEVSSTGNACAEAGVPAAIPATHAPQGLQRTIPRTLQVRNGAATLQMAQLGN